MSLCGFLRAKGCVEFIHELDSFHENTQAHLDRFCATSGLDGPVCVCVFFLRLRVCMEFVNELGSLQKNTQAHLERFCKLWFG